MFVHSALSPDLFCVYKILKDCKIFVSNRLTSLQKCSELLLFFVFVVVGFFLLGFFGWFFVFVFVFVFWGGVNARLK